MGQIRSARPRVLPVFAAFSKYEWLLDELPRLLSERFEPITHKSERFRFTETDYYATSMGKPLYKQLFAGSRLRPVDYLPTLKGRANEFEEEVRARGDWDVDRPLNLDPGTVDLAKFILASTKDHAHRLYLTSGIYGEITLHYRKNRWTAWPWTYPDYRRSEVIDFLEIARETYRSLAGVPNGR
jgi:hypothetical protein